MKNVRRVIGLFVGRFQPFHSGHLFIIKRMVRECDEIIIVIGSAQISHVPDNPFTAGERYQMIKESLKEIENVKDFGFENFHIIPVQDLNRYDLWVNHIESLVPPFNVVYTRSPFVQQLFEESNYNIIIPEKETFDIRSAGWQKRIVTDRISASKVRELMLIENHWVPLVPVGTEKIIKAIKGIDRLKMITKKDE